MIVLQKLIKAETEEEWGVDIKEEPYDEGYEKEEEDEEEFYIKEEPEDECLEDEFHSSGLREGKDEEEETIYFKKIKNSKYPIVLLRKLRKGEEGARHPSHLSSKDVSVLPQLHQRNCSSNGKRGNLGGGTLVASSDRKANVIYLKAKHLSSAMASPSSNRYCSVDESTTQSAATGIEGFTHQNQDFVRIFKCSKCSYATNFKDAMDSHAVMHSDKRPFKCHVCSYAAKRKGNLKSHMVVHSGMRTLKCKFCSFTALRPLTFRAHLDSHLKSRKFNEATHPSSKKNGNVEKCPTTTKTNNNSNETSEVGNVGRPFKCEHCPFAATDKSTFRNHIPIHFEEKPFKCDQCGYAAKRKYSLVNNFLTHSGKNHSNDVRSFKCEHCPFAASDKSTLRNHIPIHSEEKPFKCDHCGYATKRKCTLVKHILTHSRERPFKCNKCQHSTTQKYLLRKHMLTHKLKIHNSRKSFKCHLFLNEEKKMQSLDLHWRSGKALLPL